MAKRTNNKEAKPKVTEKPKAINWDEIPQEVIIIGLDGKHLESGKEYKVTKEMAQILVIKKAAKLK